MRPMSEANNLIPPVLTKSDQNLVWLDCEMTGLEPETDRLLEIAVVVTGPGLEPRIEGPVFAIHQPDALLDKMDAWNKGTHGRSGLIDKVKASTVTEEEAEGHLAALPIEAYPESAYRRSLPAARRYLGLRDPDDIGLAALALHLGIPVWSNDKDFRVVPVDLYPTAKLLKVLGL